MAQEPASIGSLLELAHWSLDILRHHPADLAKASREVSSEQDLLPAYDSAALKQTSGVILEMLVVLITSQLALALHRPTSAATAEALDDRGKFVPLSSPRLPLTSSPPFYIQEGGRLPEN